MNRQRLPVRLLNFSKSKHRSCLSQGVNIKYGYKYKKNERWLDP